MPERAGVVHVQVGLDDIANGARGEPQCTELGDAVLVLGHLDLEAVSERAPVRVRVAGDGQRVAAVDQHVALGVAEQEERHRGLHATGSERPAVEQVELKAARHVSKRRRTPPEMPRQLSACVEARMSSDEGSEELQPAGDSQGEAHRRGTVQGAVDDRRGHHPVAAGGEPARLETQDQRSGESA